MHRNSLTRLVSVSVAALALAACNAPSASNPRLSIRLSPLSASGTALDAARLVDRDTTEAVKIASRTTLTLHFGHAVEVRRVKVHGASALHVDVAGLTLGPADEAGWASGTLSTPINASELTVTLEPTGSGAQLDELEVWGAGRDLAPRDPSALATATGSSHASEFENAWVLRATPAEATLQPAGVAEGSQCIRARLPAGDPRQARRAYLAFEANVVRGDVLQHSFNGEAPAGGLWVGSVSGSRTVLSEVDPERLRGGDEVLLCLPDDAGGAVTVSGLRLLLVLDDGRNPFDRDTWLRLRDAVDGDGATTAGVTGSSDVAFDRTIDVESAQLQLGHVPARLEDLGVRDGAAWKEQPGVDVSASPFTLPIVGRADAVRIAFSGSARTDVPAASLGEVEVSASGVGPRVGTARIVLSSPTLAVSGGREVGERFGGRALVSGWAESSAGRGSVELDGARVDVDGAFSEVLERSDATADGWPVTLRARFPDGSEVTRTVYLDDDRESDLLVDASADSSSSSNDRRFGRENQTGWGTFDPANGGKVTLGTDVTIEAPPGAVGARTSTGITRKGPEVMPHLDAGMINVTAPAHGAYRFVPKGQKFAKPVKVTIPYDPDLLPEGVAPEEVQTYYFDEDQGRWFALPRRQVLRATQQIVSETTHFTFMINAVLVMPDHPGPASFNPNSIKDLKAADPSAGIDLVEPPEGNDQGSARLSFPIRLPRARGAYQPALALSYDSTAGDGWLGVGWELPVSHVSIDTRYGVPEYSGDERYLLDGAAIVPVPSSGSGPACLDGSVAATEYRERVQRDFRRILRCGNDATRYWFEVTDKAGTLFVYGHGDNARLTSYVPRVTVPPESPQRYDIAEWYLERVVDTNRNLTQFAYQHDSPDGRFTSDSDPTIHREPFRQIYLRSIQYTGSSSRTDASALEGGTPGVYLVELHHETQARPDEITSARSGFKTDTRWRLKEIEVRLLAGSPSGLIRRYELTYKSGDLGKSLLSTVAVQGADGKGFYSHTFEYESKAPLEDGVTLFADPTPWITDTGKDDALNASADWSFGFHGFVGIGVSAYKGNGTVGVGFGYGRRQGRTFVSMVDLNGDGLPDRVYDTESTDNPESTKQILFNQGGGKALSAGVPSWDPAAGGSVTTVLAGHHLGKEVGNSFDASVQAFYGAGSVGGSVNIGASYALSSSKDFVIDANGDGLPDLVNGGKVLFNQPRQGTTACDASTRTCCASNGFCFSASADFGALGDLGDSIDLVENDPTLLEANAEMEDALRPEDAVLEWTAPYPGSIDIAAQLAFINPTTAGDRRDGVRLRIYRYDPPTAESLETLGTYVKPPGDASVTPVTQASVPVSAGTILYFVLSTLTDFPMNGLDGSLSPVELVSFNPVITYLGTPATGGRVLKGPSGAPLYRFDAAADFVIAGDPPSAVNVPRDGRIASQFTITKNPTSDDVRVCVQYQDPPPDGQTPPPVPGACAEADSGGFVDHGTYKEFTKKYGSTDTLSGVALGAPQLDAKAGGKLYFRVETDVAIDPRSVRAAASGAYACVQRTTGGPCEVPLADEQQRLTFSAVPYMPLHSELVISTGKFWTPWGSALVPYRVKKAGTIQIDSSADYADRDVPIYFTARTQNRLLFKEVGNHAALDHMGRTAPVRTTVNVEPGDLVFFEAHSESGRSFDLVSAGIYQPLTRPQWNLTCWFTSADGKSGESCGANAQFTTDGHLDPWEDGNRPVLAGGFHGWRYGAWSGKAEDAFEPWVYRGPTKDEADGWDGDSKDVVDAKKKELQEEDDPQHVRLKLAGLLVPSLTGTNPLPTSSDQPGFEQSGVAYVSQDGNTYFSIEATGSSPTLRMHAGQKGRSAAFAEETPDGDDSGPVRFAIGKVGRSSAAITITGGGDMSLGAFGQAGVALSEGLSGQKMDVLDMNGDGIVDVVVGAGLPSVTDGAFWRAEDLAGHAARSDVRVTRPTDLTTGRTVRMDGYPLVTKDIGGQVNVGVSAPMKELTSRGNTKAMVSRFPGMGGGVAFSVGAVLQELVDVNGDGLPDQLRVGARDCESGIAVHLNMGTSFAAGADCLKLKRDGDSEDAVPGDAVLASVHPVKGIALRRSNTVTAQGTAGASLMRVISKLDGGIDHSESWGVSIGGQASITATNVALVDVTGDGLPDYVYKANGGETFIVRVNEGYRFAPPQAWKESGSWCLDGECATKPRMHLGVPEKATAILSAFLGQDLLEIEPLEATGSHSELPSVSFSVDFAFPLFLGTPWLHVGGGASVSPRTVSGFELGLEDIDGDGLADQVLKTADNGPVWARLNQLAKTNLLKRVVRPLGGSIELAYERREGNTVEMPQSRWVLTKVTAHDGRTVDGGPGHDLDTTYEYESGHYDRFEREFIGFEAVTRTNPDATKLKQIFRNKSVLTKGLLASETVTGPGERQWVETVNSWTEVKQTGASEGCANTRPFQLDEESYCSSFFPRLDAVQKASYEGQSTAGIVTRQEFTYDEVGNVTGFRDLGDVADPADDVLATITYERGDDAAKNLYSVSRPGTVLVTDPSGRTLRSRSASYDRANGNLLTFTADVGDGRSATTELHWYDNGTLQSVQGPENEARQRYTVTYAYDGITGTYVTGISDSHGYASSAEYDLRFGEATRTTDVNGKVTARTFDAFGRLERLAGPKDTLADPTVWISYAPDAAPAYAWTHNRLPRSASDQRGSVDTVIVMDGLGRTIQTKKTAEIATSATTKGVGWSVSGNQVFDAMGRVALQGQTFANFSARPDYVAGAPRNSTRMLYDALGRMIQTVEPNGAVTRVAYGFGTPAGAVTRRFQIVTTDAEGHAKAVYKDGADRVVAVEERIEGRTPTTTYEYDPVGDLKKVVDAAGNVTWAEYDLLGRRTKLVNPDAGELRFELDLAGNVVHKYDPNLTAAGHAIHYVYDFDQLVKIEYPDSSRNVTYTYGTAADAARNGVGRIVTVQDEAGTESRSYDELGSLASSTRVLKAMPPYYKAQTFTTSFTWDSFGRMLSITYPDQETVAYQYDAGGLLERATGTRPAGSSAPGTEVYLASLMYDEFGQRVRMVLGNGVASTYSYEPLTRRLHTLNTVTPLKRTLQALTYGYDLVGNVRTMVNALGSPAEDRSGAVRYEFQYDDLYRLTMAHGEAESRPHTIDRFTATYAFTDIHNMTVNVQVHEILHGDQTVSNERPPQTNHEFAYAYDPAHPHRATKIGDTFVVYDANGNTTAECRSDAACSANADHLRRFGWTEENRLDYVIEGGGKNVTRFVYDAGGDRVVKLGRGGESITIGQFWSLKGRRAATKHVFAGATRLASKLLPPPGWSGSDTETPPTGGSSNGTTVGDGSPNDTGCDPSNYQPQKCPVLPGGEPTVNHHYDDTTVRPETYYYHPDHLGSTSWVTDQNGKVHEHVEYFPYGEVWRDPQSDSDGAPVMGQRFLFTSKEFDEETGLYSFGLRYSDPVRARWLSADPADRTSNRENRIALNPYQSELWSPVNTVDPDGAREPTADESARIAEIRHYADAEAKRGWWHRISRANDAYNYAAGWERAIHAAWEGEPVVPVKTVVPDVVPSKLEDGSSFTLIPDLAVTWYPVGILVPEIRAPNNKYGIVPSAPPEIQTNPTAARAVQLGGSLPANSRGRVTMGVGMAVDENGIPRVLVGTSEARGYLRPGVKLAPGETLVSGRRGTHAEADIVNYARENGLRLMEVGATRPICQECARLIEAAGARPVTPLKGE